MGFSFAWNKFRIAFSSALQEASKMVTKEAETELLNASEIWLNKTDSEWPKSAGPFMGAGGDDMHPWFSGNLHDSVSVRIAEGMRTIGLRFMPMAAGDVYQDATAEDAGRDYPEIRGYVEGRLVAGRASRVRQNGLVAQLFIGVPYAQKVNTTGGPHGDHKGFAFYLMKDFQHDMTQAMDRVATKNYKVNA